MNQAGVKTEAVLLIADQNLEQGAYRRCPWRGQSPLEENSAELRGKNKQEQNVMNSEHGPGFEPAAKQGDQTESDPRCRK
jgi:hypothetical protein